MPPASFARATPYLAVDNNWAVGSIVGIWGARTGIVGATGRDQLTSMVANYGPRTTAYCKLDDGVYEFTYQANGVDGWLCSRERVSIAADSKIFSPANLRTARHELPGYGELLDYWMANRYTLRFCGGLVPDICQQFTKGQGVLANPPGGPTAPVRSPPAAHHRTQDTRRALLRASTPLPPAAPALLLCRPSCASPSRRLPSRCSSRPRAASRPTA